MSVDFHTVQWLLESDNPSVRYLSLRDLIDDPDPKSLASEQRKISTGPIVAALYSGQQEDGGFGVHPYTKWSGAHWRLVSLVEQGIPQGDRRAVRMARHDLEWLTSQKHKQGIVRVNGRFRVHASMEGNALAACSILGLTDKPVVRHLADALVDWQWPDGGWNCDSRPLADHSSFHESLLPLWGLVEFSKASGEKRAYQSSIDRATEFFLKHKLYRSCGRSGRVIKEEWLKLHYPPYWHYDILQGALVLSRAGKIRDRRADEAVDLIFRRRRSDGRWRPGAYYWRQLDSGPGGRRGKDNWWEAPSKDVVDWGRGGPSEMLTLNALRVLKAAGRFHPD